MIPSRIFVSGTDTDVGKTVVSAALVVGLEACYWKPVQAGTEPATDTEQVRSWTEIPESRLIPEVYRLRTPASPHAAAELDGTAIDLDRIVRTSLPRDRAVVIEGAGGLLVPLNESALVADLIERLSFPVVLTARTGLGTLNHTLLSIAEIRRRSIPLLGVVLNGAPHESNERAIERYAQVPILGRIPRLESVNRAALLDAFRRLELNV